MKKDTQQRIICILAGMCIVLIIGLVITLKNEKSANDKLRAGYENSLYNTLDGISSIYNDLSKASFCNDRDYLRMLYSQISARAGTAAARLGELPLSLQSIQKTEELLNHISDYCGYLADKAEKQEDEGENIRGLRDSCKRLFDALDDIGTVIGAGQDVFAVDVLSDTDIAWQQAEMDSVNYPTLIYDGPFSQSEQIGKPITKRQEIDGQEALTKAKELLGDCSLEGTNQGDIPCYVFASGEKSAAYTVEGGLLLWYLDPSEPDGREISDQDAENAAREFLTRAGYDGLESVFASKGEDSIIFNFTPEVNGAVIYPDLVKVRVSLKSGRVTGFEGSGYIICNRERNIDEPAVNEKDASKQVSGMLSIKKTRLSVIPHGNGEAIAWEFYCICGEDKYIVYIDALSGKQIQMYRIIPTENGDMVI